MTYNSLKHYILANINKQNAMLTHYLYFPPSNNVESA